MLCLFSKTGLVNRPSGTLELFFILKVYDTAKMEYRITKIKEPTPCSHGYKRLADRGVTLEQALSYVDNALVMI